MEIFFSEKGTLDELKLGLAKMSAYSGVKSIFILACDNNYYSPEDCDPILKSINKPIWGGIFPSIIFEDKRYENGLILLGLANEAILRTIKNISSSDIDFEASIENLVDNNDEIKTMSVLVDGFSKRINALIDALFMVFGLDYNFIGGGTGSLSMKQKPCIITNDGLLMDSAIIAGIKAECEIGVQHGWNSISGPYKITSSENNVIKSIDYKPAFSVYKQMIDEHSGKDLSHENFFEIAKAYPFGINKLGAEKVVRDPLTSEGDNLICVGEVPEGAFIDVLHGNKATLISAAKKASKKSSFGIRKEEIDFVLLFDCISRVLFLENDFNKELNAVKQEKVPLIGALSIGEIANNKKDYLEFYNKTAVVATFKK